MELSEKHFLGKTFFYSYAFKKPFTLVGICLRELKPKVHTKTCRQIVIAALFLRAKKWKQPKCLSNEEWIKKIWYNYTMDYYSAIKKTEVWIPAKHRLTLKISR